VTTAALWSAPFTPLIAQETFVVALWTTSGRTVAVQVPTTALDCGSVIVKVTVEGAPPPLRPPRFFSVAATTHGEAQPEVSTDTTV